MITTRVTLRSRLPELTRSLQLRVSKDVRETAEAILETANNDLDSRPTSGMSPNTPATSGTGKVTGGAGQNEVRWDAYWANWVENGRKNAPPYPFAYPAAEAEREPFEDRVKATLRTL